MLFSELHVVLEKYGWRLAEQSDGPHKVYWYTKDAVFDENYRPSICALVSHTNPPTVYCIEFQDPGPRTEMGYYPDKDGDSIQLADTWIKKLPWRPIVARRLFT